jgi:hypothetical protein
VAPPGNQAANRENKLQPIVSEETGLLDSINHLLKLNPSTFRQKMRRLHIPFGRKGKNLRSLLRKEKTGNTGNNN